jgi:serine/threonine protein kinase
MYETQAELDEFFKCLFQFRPVRKLGEGGFGTAILVFDEVEQVQKVFKLPKDQHTTEALLQEGANLRKLSELLHPNIIRLHQYGKVCMEWNDVKEERYYLNMAFGGTSLRAKLGPLRIELDADGNAMYFGSGRRLALDESLRIAIDVCMGLEAAHGFRGAPVRMLHRDIKPDNILIDDETGVARLTDFGISRIIDRSSALVSFAGTLLYMAPECFKGKAGVQSDIYSLGMVIYEMVTGQLPFRNFVERVESPPRNPQEIVPDLPPELAAICSRTLDNDLEVRYSSASELLADLRKVSAKLNPLPARYTKLGELEDGRLLCEDGESGERVAVRLLTNPATLGELAQCSQLETQAFSGIQIPLRHFRNEQILGIVSRLPHGDNLVDRFGRGALKQVEGLALLCQTAAAVCDVLSAVHGAGICHGFLSPFAITLVGQASSLPQSAAEAASWKPAPQPTAAAAGWKPAPQPVLHELGNSQILRARRLAGAPPDSLDGLEPQLAYMSPQMLAGTHDPGPQDDIFSLGAILYALLVGRPPLGEQDRARAIRREPVAEGPYNPRELNPLVPLRLAALVVKAIQWNPHDRYGSAADMAVALRACKWPDDAIDALIDDALKTYQPGGSNAELIRACQLIDRVLWLAPGNARAHFARGVIYFRNGSFNYAIEELGKAARIAPDRDVFDLLGQSHERWITPRDVVAAARKYHEAVAAYRKALEFGEDPLVLDHLARALHALGQHAEAQQRMRRSLELESDESIRERRRFTLNRWSAEAGRKAAPPPADVPIDQTIESGASGKNHDTLTQPPRDSGVDP